jgi:hypothetical protein
VEVSKEESVVEAEIDGQDDEDDEDDFLDLSLVPYSVWLLQYICHHFTMLQCSSISFLEPFYLLESPLVDKCLLATISVIPMCFGV